MEILVIFILTLLNGFFALSEIALVSVKKSRIEQLASEGSKKAKTVLKLLNNPENFLSSVQVGITLIGIVAGAYGGAALSDDLTPYIASIEPLARYASQIAITIIIGLITYFTIVIGELIPKTIAMKNPESIALSVAPVIRIFTAVTFPLVKLLSGSTSLLLRIFGFKKDADGASLTEDELRHLIKVAGKEGVLEAEEERLHDNLFYLYDLRNRSLMTYRTEVEWLDVTWPQEKIREVITSSAHTRFPVCEGDIDKVIGVLSVKDYYQCPEGTPLKSILSKPIFLSEHMLVMSTLKVFQKKRKYMAFVVNEFGTVEGILTLHDIMEAIVGDLPDVDESMEPDVFEREDGSYLVNGAVIIRHLNQALNTNLIPDIPERYATLAGFILYELSNIPRIGTKLTIENFELEVIDLDGSRIDKVLLTRLPEPVLDEDEDSIF
ncbi:hemolysin family protein [Pontibacter arcticus]|uniref:HlyC/CorC family transporter n=1 Tax=Pontibacter arcticus TaxID=2080288 RepID=A0A364RJN8_9BACT|nr:hemolysin family protein [Pontibacter arcticus]RAU84494.1 HlyC/CorC family transporter [Pontibacter arcticus]